MTMTARRYGCVLVLLLGACSGEITDTGGGGDDDPGQPDGSPAQPGDPDAAQVPTGLSPELEELHRTINGERAARGLVEVTLRDDLICAAGNHSADVGPIELCDHTGTDGSQPGDRVADCGGGGWSGEIIACGQGTPRSAVDAWLGSPGHNAIMLDPGQRSIGVGMTNNFWTAIFDR